MTPVSVRGRPALLVGLVAAALVGTAALVPVLTRADSPAGPTAGTTAGLPDASLAAASAPANLISNPSAETLTRGVPKGWVKGWTGVNTYSLTVVRKGGASGPAFVRTRVTSYTSGGAWWATPAVAVAGGSTYTFSDSYRAGTATRVLAAATVAGKTVWLTLGTAPASASWRKASYTVTVPAGTTALRVAHTLRAVGQLDVDGVSLTRVASPAASGSAPAPTPVKPAPGGGSTPQPQPASGGMVSFTFDDGTADHYSRALPMLKANGQVGTFYLISAYLGASNYLTVGQAKELQAAGNEVGAHTVNHPNLTQISEAEVERQFSESKQALEANFGPVTDVAYPYGASNDAVRRLAAKYYASGRSTDGGLNVPGSYDKYRLTIGYVLNSTSQGTIDQWIAQAKANNTWLILCYHGIGDNKPDDPYTVTVNQFGSALSAVKSAGIRVVTVRDGLKLSGS